MADVLTASQRKLNMSRIRSRDTKPEMIVRSLVHSMGYRYRLHSKDLPGSPDLVFPRLRKIIFVHGCFFHMHECRFGNVTPKTNSAFWKAKRNGNVQRDRSKQSLLLEAGWEVYVVWECETKPAMLPHLPGKLRKYLAYAKK